MERWNIGIMGSTAWDPPLINIESFPGFCPNIPLFHSSIVPMKNAEAMSPKKRGDSNTLWNFRDA